MLTIDHVVLAVANLDASANRLLADHGLSSVAGGRHPAWGTGNRIVPLGATYIELLAAVEPDVASTNEVGRAVASLAADCDRWFAVCLADDDLDATARRLGLAVVTGERERPDGRTVRWRSCGFEDDPERVSRLPFFIEWDVPPGEHPGRTPCEHPSGANGIAFVDMGDEGQLAGWLGKTWPRVELHDFPGPPGIRNVRLSTNAGPDIVL